MCRIHDQRSEHREHRSRNSARSVSRSVVESWPTARLDPLRGEGRDDRVAGTCGVPDAYLVLHARSSPGSAPRRQPAGALTASPAAIRRSRPATRTMKNSSRLLAKIARKLAPLQQRRRFILGQLKDALVEPEPALLAIEVTVRQQLTGAPTLLASAARRRRRRRRGRRRRGRRRCGTGRAHCARSGSNALTVGGHVSRQKVAYRSFRLAGPAGRTCLAARHVGRLVDRRQNLADHVFPHMPT